MGDISRDSDWVELNDPPRFDFGERVVSRHVVRNDGTYPGLDIGAVLVNKGDIGYVTSVGTFLQQFYIYAVDFVATGCRVGMKGRELMSLDKLPPELALQLGPDKVARLRSLAAAPLAPTPEHSDA
ncbi:MAG: nitrogen fixation protein NifZ [Thiomonas sp.]|uniref:nitrogen fixation protein NifZ n=1 Tax=Thiomonas sp. TaxID=2047785 RepID=UPI002A35F47F|nr:nitrogen fixation protein NifZ [Thiomonas sp.]MDY0329797.1 nitrogen fixation protein NifZ [Thiomonas sp.]